MTSVSRPSDILKSVAGGDAPDGAPTATGEMVTRDGARTRASWHVAAEVPLALLYDGEQFGVMMVTPCDLEDFALGFTLTEGIVADRDEILDIRLAEGGDGVLANVRLAGVISESARERRRSILAGSACGICGAQTIESALPKPPRVRGDWPAPDAVLTALSTLPDHQPMNRRNRSTHAAAFALADGRIILTREDIGRHNALDKLAGAMAREAVDPESGFIVLSSRLSVEMVVKAARIGVPFVASVSAPSALALAKADQAGMGAACAAAGDLMIFGNRTT